MADRKNINPKFGLLLPEVYDIRTIPLRSVLRLKELPPLPLSHDAHEEVGGLEDNRMFNNSKYGDCVIAAQAHQTLTFEKFEQGEVISITDQEVVDEYFRQTGGEDSGLYLAFAMKEWKNTGWTAAGRHHDIYAYASVDKPDLQQVKYSIYLLRGVFFGMQVFETDMEQFRNGEPWHLTGHSGNFLGGHGVYGFAYHDDALAFSKEVPTLTQGQGMAKFPTMDKTLTWSESGLTCITWGEEQFMTWDFWNARVNQVYAVVDNRNDWLGKDSPVDVNKLDGYLEEITGETNSGYGCACPWLTPLIRRLRG